MAGSVRLRRHPLPIEPANLVLPGGEPPDRRTVRIPVGPRVIELGGAPANRVEEGAEHRMPRDLVEAGGVELPVVWVRYHELPTIAQENELNMAAPPNGPKGWWDKETNKLPAAAIEGPSQPGAHGPIVFLLGNRTSHADFEGFARGHDWLIHEDRPSTGPKSAYEQIWVTPDRSTAIHYMDDPTPKERFLVVHGREAGAVAFQMGAANLDIHTSEDVFNLAMVASSTPERITVAWQLAVTSRLYDEAVLGILWAL